MTDYERLYEAVGTLARDMLKLQKQAAKQYKPVVDDILRTRCRDVRRIEHTLDRLLDFCGHEPVLRMYKGLCRHYWDIDPAATAYYVNAYRDFWDGDAQDGPPGRPYVRVGSTTRRMPQEKYERLLLQRGHARRRWENQPAEGLKLKDLDRVHYVLDGGSPPGRRHGRPHNASGFGVEET